MKFYSGFLLFGVLVLTNGDAVQAQHHAGGVHHGGGAHQPGLHVGGAGRGFPGRGLGAFGGAFGAGGGNNWGGYGLFNQSPTAYYDLYWEERMPYFAVHPPVYYSVPMPRTYGYSPFAYPGEVPTPEVQFGPPPETIINPHAQPAKSSAPLPDQTAQQPLRIANPFVDENIATAPNSESNIVPAVAGRVR